jgi:lipopolysaccharide transport system ATP-binding protein
MTLPADIAIRLTGLSKKYRLFDNPRQRLKEALDPRGRTYHKDFWALRDISLTIPKGHTIGILGRNGSGKSTLLQIITSVLQPTAGTVEVNGRIAALLELGAGFDPEFTGRDNVRQYGRIQGLEPAEIEARLPKIEEFAGIGEFFDREVKTYSSGMFARLAFAAAIHVDPDILILDEILAVGDARFQQRCLRRIQEMKQAGCTILFVSHNTEQVLKLCDVAALLDQGRLLAYGTALHTVNEYHDILYGRKDPSASRGTAETPQVEHSSSSELPPGARAFVNGNSDLRERAYYNPSEGRLGSGEAEITDILVTVGGRELQGTLEGTEHLSFWIKVKYTEPVSAPRVGWGIVTPEGIMVSGSNSLSRRVRLPDARGGELAVYRVDIHLNLCGGEYFLNFGISTYDPPDWHFIDTRRSIIHLTVRKNEAASGFVDLPASCGYLLSAPLDGVEV